MKNRQTDPFLEKYVAKYNRWLSQKKISFSSKVIPVSESIDTRQQVLPTEQVMAILGAARSVAVQNCACREPMVRSEYVAGTDFDACIAVSAWIAVPSMPDPSRMKR